MAAVMPQGHGGDGAEDPPPPGGFGRGQHEEDATPPTRRTRGKAKNKALRKEVKEHGGPLSLTFDRGATYLPVGRLYDRFVREVGMFMWRHIVFDRKSWRNVSEHEKNALHEHLRQQFNYDEVEEDIERRQLKDGIESLIQKRYRDRKNIAKKEFVEAGGYEDVDGAKAKPPEGMDAENWRRAIDFFCSDEFKSRSAANKGNRQKQSYVNRGGTASYSSHSYKNDQSRLATFYDAHTDKDGIFDSPLAEQHYKQLFTEFRSQHDPNSGVEFDSTSPLLPNQVNVFDDVLGHRRGHIKGIGRRPPSSTSSSIAGGHEQHQIPAGLTQAQLDSVFQDPRWIAQFPPKAPTPNESSDGDEDDMD